MVHDEGRRRYEPSKLICKGRPRVDLHIAPPYHRSLENTMAEAEMTVGIGFLCDDGIVLSTDTQYSGALKLRGEKLFEITGIEGLSVCIAGAGRVSLIRKAVQLIGKRVSGSGSKADVPAAVEECISEIYAKHVNTYVGSEDSRPTLELLVGVWQPPSPLSLWASDRTALTRVSSEKCYEAIGSGGYLADYIINTLSALNIAANTAKYLSAYMIKMAMQYVLFCGGETRIKTMLPSGLIETATQEEVEGAQQFFARLLESNKQIMLGMDPWNAGDDELEYLIEDHKAMLLEFRHGETQRRSKKS